MCASQIRIHPRTHECTWPAPRARPPPPPLPLGHPPLPRFPCTRCRSERRRASRVVQYCQTWRRIYSPSGFRASLLPGVTGSLGMDASSSSSKHTARPSEGATAQLVSFSDSRESRTRGNETRLPLFSQQRGSQEHDLAASSERRGGDHRPQENPR